MDLALKIMKKLLMPTDVIFTCMKVKVGSS